MNDCIRYFKKYAVYGKLFTAFREKYESLGHFGGTVTLTGLSSGEISDLFGFFNKDYTGKAKVTITAKQMEKALAGSRFSDYTWEEILAAYFEESLTVKKEEKQKEREQKEKWFLDLYRELEKRSDASIAEWFFNLYQNRQDGYSWLVQKYREEAKGAPSCPVLKKLLDTVIHCMEQLPLEKPELFNVFAARMTGNPHFFDSGTEGERLILLYLKYWDERQHFDTDGDDSFESEKDCDDSGLEQKTMLLYQAGLLKDDLSNDVLVYGIHGVTADGRYHEGIEGFTKEKEPMKLTLATVGKLSAVLPAGKMCMCEADEKSTLNESAGKDETYNAEIWNQRYGNNIYIVENPAVFSYLAGQYPNITAVCGNGQIRLATLYLLDRFPESCSFYYAGDFDPEGLLIAQRLKKRYRERLYFWKYDTAFYMENLSEVLLDESRLKKLEAVTMPELQPLCGAIRREKRAAYQECMMEAYSVV